MHQCLTTFATTCQGSETLAQTMHTILLESLIGKVDEKQNKTKYLYDKNKSFIYNYTVNTPTN